MDIHIEEGHKPKGYHGTSAQMNAQLAAAMQMEQSLVRDHLDQLVRAYTPDFPSSFKGRQIGRSFRVHDQIVTSKAWTEPCMVCDAPCDVSEADYCCSGGMWEQCGCGGRPQGPIACSDICYDALMSDRGKTPADVKVVHNIPPWFDPETLFKTLT